MEMDYRSAIFLAIVISASPKIDAKLNVIPRDTEVKINDSTYMNCSTSLQANLIQWRHGNYYVYTGIAILEPYNDGRFSIEINATTGASNLVIRSVQPSDAGKYECLEDEGFGETGTTELIVLDALPVCKSNVNSDGVIGPNSCDVIVEEIKLSCSITYHGNVLPILQWKALRDNESITEGLISVTSNNNEVTYSLTVKSELGLNNSSFVCQTTRTTKEPYTCASNAISILYVFSRKVKVNMTLNDEVSCSANSSQSCSYKWKWFSGEDSSTESDNQILKPKKVGWHRCDATCSFGNKSCVAESMQAYVYSDAATNGQNLMPLLALLLVPVLGAIGVIMYRWIKQKVQKRRLEEIELNQEQEEQHRLLEQRHEEERLRSLGLIMVIQTKAAAEEMKSIIGLAILDNELFVVNDKCSEVEIYDSMKLSFSRQWNLKTLISAQDIVSCERNKCLYISDNKEKTHQSKEILRVDPNGNLIRKWLTKDNYGGMSVTYESNIILAACEHNKLIEYSPDGTLIREIKLPPEEGFRHPLHAIKLTNGQFVVSHGVYEDDYDDNLHRVCIVDVDGKLLKSFGGKPGSTITQMDIPIYLSVNRNECLIVADSKNSRVLLLDSDLKFKKEILTGEHGLQYPSTILLDESSDRLFVADNDVDVKRILIFYYNEETGIFT